MGLKKLKGVNIKHLDLKDKGGKPIETFTELERENLKYTCDCGVDCCKNVIFLKDVVTGEASVLYIEDGELTIKTKAEFEANGY